MAIRDDLNPYAWLMAFRRTAYERGWLRSVHPGIPIVSVGNLTMGGTGKSPLVLLLTEYLERKGKQVAIVSRGYKRRSNGFLLVCDGKKILADVEQSGDEPQMFARLAPNAIVIVDEDRARGACEASALGADVIVLDDGFQHLRLRRDLNILIATAPSAVIPFGRAREPKNAVRAADFLIATDERFLPKGTTIPSAIVQNVPTHCSSMTGTVVPLTEITGKRVLALSSIASPERFHRMLREQGAEVIPRDLGDHAEYSAPLVAQILHGAENAGVEAIVTTAKDIVKSQGYFERAASSIPVFIVHHTLEFLHGEERFYHAIDRIL